MKEEKVLLNASLGFLLEEGKILLAKKSDKIGAGCWNGYGGGIEDGETPEESLSREFNEEAGIEVVRNSLEKIAIVDFHNTKSDGKKFICRVHIYFIREWTGQIVETEEMLSPTWFELDKLPYDEMMPADRIWMPEILKGKKIIAKAYLGPFQKELLKEEMEIIYINSF